MSEFNSRLCYIKETLNLTALEMASRIGIPQSTFSLYLKYREPKYDVLIRISKEFNVSVGWLIGACDDGESELIKENKKLRDQLKAIKKIADDIV